MDIYMRSIEERLDERFLKGQTEKLQDSSSRCRLTISDVGIEMMTALVGRAMAPSLRRCVVPSLYETLNGQMSSPGYGQGDLLTEVYGEVLGPLVVYFHDRTYPEIIRLVATENVSCPDLLLFDPQKGEAMLLECKGVYIDLGEVVKNPHRLDVCDKLRKKRNEGKGQLSWPDQNTVWTAGVSIKGLQRSARLPIPAFEEAVVASAIPDGRIRTYAGDIQPPRRKGCPLSCDIQCLFDDIDNPYITSVLHTRSKSSKIGLAAEWKQFLEWYKAAERAL